MHRPLPVPLRLPLLLLLLALSGCATLDENECRTVDWRELGLKDGRSGYSDSRLAEHREACVKHGIVPDDTAYREGRRIGLQDYCIPDTAIREGLAGRRYQGVCPPGIDRDFRDLNDAAYGVYSTRNDITSTENQIDSLERELRNDKTSDKRRRQIRDDIRDLDRKRDRLRDELRWKERELDRLTDQLVR